MSLTFSKVASTTSLDTGITNDGAKTLLCEVWNELMIIKHHGNINTSNI